MTIHRNDKLKSLISKWPSGCIVTNEWLAQRGVNRILKYKYIQSGWLEIVGHGAVKLAGSEVDWLGALYGLHFGIHIGGKTALELKGQLHSVPLGNTKRHLYLYKKVQLPKWMKSDIFASVFETHSYSYLNQTIAIENYPLQDSQVQISSSERALLEIAQDVSDKDSFVELHHIVENLASLRPAVLQTLLELCSSVKIKRIVLFLADHVGHRWFENIDLTKIDIGKGERQIVLGGSYSKKFKITVPRELYADESKF